MSTAARRLEVLRAIVIEYVNTKEPVASKAVASSHVTGVSSATIRNDMGVLEGEGLIRQPHTSAGRVPTEAGYRLFVECLDPSLTLAGKERRMIEAGLRESSSVDEAISRTVRVLAGLTGQVAVAEYPELGTDIVRKVEVVDLAPGHYLALVVTAAGGVHESRFDAVAEPDGTATDEADSWEAIRDVVNASVSGISVRDLAARLRDARSGVPRNLLPFYDEVCGAVAAAVKPLESARLATAGAANLLRSGVEVVEVARLLELVEDSATLLRLLHQHGEDRVHVAIGAEQLDMHLEGVSVISASYGDQAPGHTHVGVVGPTRMDYARSLAAVDAVSHYLSRLLWERSGHLEGELRKASSTGEVTE